MLKITTTQDDGFERELKLEGRLMAEWVGVLQDAVRTAQVECGRLQLDLGDLKFVDATGTIALRELIRQGVVITTVSPFVGELLKEK